MSNSSKCRICDGNVVEFFDFGRQPLSDAFVEPGADPADEFFFRLAVGLCEGCSMVQLMEEVPRDRMFNESYPYFSSGSSVMREHFESLAKRLLATELDRGDAFVVELGCNDGVMLRTIADAGVRHLGVEPSASVAAVAADNGVRTRTAFFEEATAREIRAEDGPADVIYAANTLCHIPYMTSILRGVRALLRDTGVFVFEDPYLGDIVRQTSFDQIYDEHFYFFTLRAVDHMARLNGLELVDAERLSVHGGELRYTLAPAGAREPSRGLVELRALEDRDRLTDPATLREFGARVEKNRDDLVALLRDARDHGRRVVAYGATAKSATVTNLCGIGPDLVEFVCDTTPAKQGRLTPGMHIPVRDAAAFSDPYPDYALLFAWNHADEIMAKETAFAESGGKWIVYVPTVGLV